MQPKEQERWARSREKGMLAYVFLTGVAAYGVPMFVAMTFLFHDSKLSVAQSAALWLSAGAVYGMATWFVQEYRYRKATKGE
jgi:hypothetical protein